MFYLLLIKNKRGVLNWYVCNCASTKFKLVVWWFGWILIRIVLCVFLFPWSSFVWKKKISHIPCGNSCVIQIWREIWNGSLAQTLSRVPQLCEECSVSLSIPLSPWILSTEVWHLHNLLCTAVLELYLPLTSTDLLFWGIPSSWLCFITIEWTYFPQVAEIALSTKKSQEWEWYQIKTIV